VEYDEFCLSEGAQLHVHKVPASNQLFYSSIDQIWANKIGVSFSGHIANYSYDSGPPSALGNMMQVMGWDEWKRWSLFGV
jgi:hypothetical protein